MNKSLSLLFCLSLVLPVYAMEEEDGSLQPYMSTSRRMAHRVWEAVSCKKVFITAVCVGVLALISTSGYFLTTTCLTMRDKCADCTHDFSEANCGLKLLNSYASLLQKLIQQHPDIAFEYATELTHLNDTAGCN